MRVGRPPRRSGPRKTPNNIGGPITRMKNIYLRFLLRRNSWKSTRNICLAGGLRACRKDVGETNDGRAEYTTIARNHRNVLCMCTPITILWALQSSVYRVGRAPARAYCRTCPRHRTYVGHRNLTIGPVQPVWSCVRGSLLAARWAAHGLRVVIGLLHQLQLNHIAVQT